jgi:hypothetical protein
MYGFQVTGLGDPAHHLVPAEADWPRLRVEQARGTLARTPAGTVRVTEDRAEIWVTDHDRVDMDRATLTVRFTTGAPLGDEILVHPYLALPASIASHWLGRMVFHGGAFLLAGRAWALLGDKEAGKSSTLGWLSGNGHQVLSDDILMVDEGLIYSGPRSIDLRGDAAERFGGEDLGVLGSRGRWRLRPEQPPPSAPLAGVIHLEWGPTVSVESVPPPERVAAMVRKSVLRARPAEAASYLDLATLPTWRFSRPRDLDGLDEANAQLLDALG